MTTSTTPGKSHKRGLLMGMSPETAAWVSDWANAILVASLVIGVLATYAVVVSGNVKEAAFKREVVAANAEAAKANEAAARMNERAARLEKEAADARLEQERLREHLAWRRISKEQAQKIADALREARLRPRIFVASNDTEAASFCEDVKAVLRLAGDPNPARCQSLVPDTFRGLAAMGPNKADRIALAKAFHAGGFEVIDGGESNHLEIVIGLKLTPF
jgi:hypothetical protein